MNSLPDLFSLPDRLLALLGPDASHPLMFSSGLFWVLFVAFLPVYAWLRNRGRIAAMKIFVSAFSLYFFFHNSGWLFLLLVFTAAIDWGVSHRIASASSVGTRRAWLLFSLILSLGVLVAFKYTNFFIDNLRMLTGDAAFRPVSFTLPLGLSFYTFRTISYVVDVFRRRIDPAQSFLDYLFFLSFFPCLTAGPIVRADHFMPQLTAEALRRPVDRARIYGGFFTVLMGVIKKAVIADYLAQYSNIAFGNPSGYSGVELLMGALGYGLQIYCDFSGYSDMAIGLGAILGFDLGINFDFPYRSRNVTEFWRRWHISLSLASGLPLHPARWQPSGRGKAVCQPARDHAPRRTLARRRVDVHRLGRRPWRRPLSAQAVQGVARSTAGRWPCRISFVGTHVCMGHLPLHFLPCR